MAYRIKPILKNRLKIFCNMIIRVAYYIIIILLVKSSVISQNDAVNHRKYWYFKSRLLNDFMKVGIKQGDNIIINERGFLSGSFDKANGGYNQIKIGDAISGLGYWLAVLATEYELLKQSNQSTDSTIYQIYCTLYTINRLDLQAEKVLNVCNQGSLNGFFVRDDVYRDYFRDNYEHFNYYSKGIQNNDSSRGFMSKFNFGIYNLDNVEWCSSNDDFNCLNSCSNNTMIVPGSDWYHDYESCINKVSVDNIDEFLFNSQDQIYALIYGLAFVRKFFPKNVVCKDANGNVLFFQDGLTSLSDEAKAITARLVNYAREPYNCENNNACQGIIWHIARPNCFKQSNDVGADFGAGAFTYPLAESACMIDREDWGKKNNGAHFCAPTRCKSGTPPLQNCNGLYHNPGSLSYGYTLWNWLNGLLFPNYLNQINNLPSLNPPPIWPPTWNWPNFSVFPSTEYPRLFGGLLMSVCYCEYNSLLNFVTPPSVYNTTGLYGVFTNNSKNKIDQLSRRTATTYYYHFPYSLALLHNLKVDVNESPSNESIIDLINEMNPCNHYKFGQNNWSSFSWSTDTRTEHLERIGWGNNISGFTGEYPAYDFLLYHNLWYLYNKKQNNNGVNSYMTDLGDVLIDKNNVPVNAYNVDAYETTIMKNTPFILAPHNSHKYIRAGKEIIFKPGTHIYAVSYSSVVTDNFSDPPTTYTVNLSLNSGLRAYIKGYACSLDAGSYYPGIDPSYEYRINNYYTDITDSVIKKITEEYPGFENKYHYVNYSESVSIQDSENENSEPNQESFKNLSKYQTYKLYPIPAKEYLDIEVKGGNAEYFQILDITGKEVRNYPIISPYFQRFSLDNLPSGVYMGVIVYRNGIKDFIKFMVE